MLLQEYTNTDNPFGDAHLLETFVWQKVKPHWEINILKGYLRCMLWFKFYLGLKFFKPVWFLFSSFSDYDNQYKTMKTKHQTGLKNFKPKKNLNHNIYEVMY